VLGCLAACGQTGGLFAVPDAGPGEGQRRNGQVWIDGGTVAPDAPDAHAVTGTIAIEPPAIDVPAGRDQIFVASLPATWSVAEAGGGTIDATTGMYIAPDVPGTYHVIATSGSETGVATVVVAQKYLSVLTGRLGGMGNSDGLAGEARFASPRGVAFDGDHTLYVGDQGSLRAVDMMTNAVTTIAGNGHGYDDGVGAAAGFSYLMAVAYYPATNTVYAADGIRIRAIDVASRTVTTLITYQSTTQYADGPAATARVGNIRGMCISGSTLFLADTGGSTIRTVDLASPTFDVGTLAGTPRTPGYADNTDPTLAKFNQPSDVACTPTTVYVADYMNSVVRAIDRASGAVTTLAGSPTATYGTGDFSTVGIGHPLALTLDASHNTIYIVASDHQAIRALDLGAHTVATVVNGSPSHMEIVGSLLWYSDTAEVRTLDPASKVVTTMAGNNGKASAGSADGDLANATFTYPEPITLDASGNVLVGGNFTIRTLSLAAGEVTWRAGTPGVSGYVDGAPPTGKLGSTTGLLVDPNGTLWESSVAMAIRTIAADGTITTRFGGLGQSAHVDGFGTSARFAGPGPMVWVNGKIIVADLTDSTIREIDVSSGLVSTIAGAPGVHENLDGVGPAAHFSNPWSLATDGLSKVWIGDWGSGATIRELDLATHEVTTIVGDPAVALLEDGVGSAGHLCGPWALAYDGAHSLYIAETGTCDTGLPIAMVRRVWLPSHALSTYAGQPYRYGAHPGPLQTATLAYTETIAITPSGSLLVSGAGENAIFTIGNE